MITTLRPRDLERRVYTIIDRSGIQEWYPNTSMDSGPEVFINVIHVCNTLSHALIAALVFFLNHVTSFYTSSRLFVRVRNRIEKKEKKAALKCKVFKVARCASLRRPDVIYRCVEIKRYRVFALVLTAAAGFTLDALPPQSLNSGRQLRGELQTGRMT